MNSKIIISHDKENLKETNVFNLTLLSFATNDFNYYNSSVELLFEILCMKAKDFEAATLPNETRKIKFNIGSDNNGADLVTASTTRQFTVNGNWSEDKKKYKELICVISGNSISKKE